MGENLVFTASIGGTTVVRRLKDLIGASPPLEKVADQMGGDRSDWEWYAPGVGFDPLRPEEFLHRAKGDAA